MDDRIGDNGRPMHWADAGPDALALPPRGPVQWAIVGIFVILSVVALSLARPILLPVVAAFVVTMMLSPLSARAERHGVPALVQAILLWLLVVAAFYSVIGLLSAPVVEWVGKAPQIGQTIEEKLRPLEEPLAHLLDLRNALLPGNADKGVGIDIVSVLQPAFSVVTPAIVEIVIFFATLFFMLLGRVRIRRALVAFFDARAARLHMLRILNEIESNISDYLSMVALINLAVGVFAGIIAWLCGLPEPTAWAVLGFVLNFIPYIGALIVELSMFMVGLVTFPTLTHAALAPALYIALATIEGQFVTPSLVGRRLTLNPLVVFLSLVFWTWLWGPVGAFLAAPVLILGLVAASHWLHKDEPQLPE